MQGRKAVVLALGLMAGCAGCLTQQRQPTPPGDLRSDNETPWVKHRAGDKAKPETFVSYGRLAESGQKQPNVTAQQQKEMRDQARQAYHEALKLDAKHRDALLSLAVLHAGEDDHERAAQYFTKATKAHPKDALVWYESGMYRARRKEFPAALEELRKASALEPENRDLTAKLGFLLGRCGKTDESLACLTKVMGKAEAHFNVARMLDHLNQPEQSKAHLHIALQHKADLAPARQMLARLDTPAAPGLLPPQLLPPNAQSPGVVNVQFEEEVNNPRR